MTSTLAPASGLNNEQQPGYDSCFGAGMKITISSDQAVSAVLAPASGSDNDLQLQAVTAAVSLAVKLRK
jgi:hypothetical protein